MEKNGLTVRPTTAVANGGDSWQTMKEQAGVMLKSGFLPPSIKTAEQAMAIALTGKELGIGFMEAIRSINVIQGKPTISPQLMLALANRTKELENIEIDATEERCKITIKRKGRKEHTNEFGIKDAEKLGLNTKDNYRKQPKTMFQWRGLAANLRVTFPDVVLGLYTPEELGAEVRVSDDENMEIVDAKPQLQAPALGLLTSSEQKEMFALASQKHVDLSALKHHLKEVYGVDRSNDIRQEDYAKITEWIIVNARETAA